MMTPIFKGYLVFILNLFFVNVVDCIDCFKCISINKSLKPCEDPFHNNYTIDIFQSPCMGGKKGRNGLFPATSCIKITGVFEETGDSILIRACALDSGTLTTDTEIVRMSHCGHFYYQDKYVAGCVMSCNDADACNSSHKGVTFSILQLCSFIIIIILTNVLSK